MTKDDDGPAKIDRIIDDLGDWRGDVLAEVRAVIKQADPAVVEETKWAKATNPNGVPTWSHDGIICTGETYKAYVKLTFMQGGALEDPSGFFTTGFGGTRRAVDIHEGDKVDAKALAALVRAAVAHNGAKKSKGK